jgi:hypothetical protein
VRLTSLVSQAFAHPVAARFAGDRKQAEVRNTTIERQSAQLLTAGDAQ